MTPAEAACLAGGITVVLLPPLILLLRHHEVIDRPNRRSSHDVPTPRGGGVGVAVAAVLAIASAPQAPLASKLALACGAGLFALLGAADDLISIPPQIRLLFQIVPAILIVVFVTRSMTGPGIWMVVFALGALIWTIGFVNAFNFMDGINGIAAMQILLGGCWWWAIGESRGIPALGLGGAIGVGGALAFLPFNFPRARVFLGDVGSYFWGAWLAVLTIIGLRSGIPVDAAFAPVAVFLFDTTITLLRRLREHQPLHQAHRDHIYQRLIGPGGAHTRTALFVTGLIACTTLLGGAVLIVGPVARSLLDLSLIALLGVYSLSPRWLGPTLRTTDR